MFVEAGIENQELSMTSFRPYLAVVLGAGLLGLIQPAAAEVYPLIIRGKVTMQDGSPPPKSVGIQRLCSDQAGSAPGPLTNGKGEYTWRMDVDPMRTRVCRLEATLAGYTSTAIDISNLNGYTSTTVDLPPLVLRTRVVDPTTINSGESDVPSRSRTAWKAAMKAVDSGDLAEAGRQLQAVLQASPKFARGWHTLGVVNETLLKPSEAKEAYERAIEADPKLLPSYVTLARLAVRAKDWQGAAKAADALIRADTKRTFPEAYVHQAIARYHLKDLDGAEASAREALRPGQPQATRAEFVLARIFESRGDFNAAREHIAKYLELEPNAPDAEIIRAFLQVVGKPEGAGVNPDLALP
jgi:Tfp pilus assembly protein PilF